MKFHLFSDAFSEGESVPRRHTCEGEDHSPPLRWIYGPDDTRSFALLVTDPDAPGGTFTHWVLFDIPPDVDFLEEGVQGIGVMGRNDFQGMGWSGPCPPPAHGDHHYRFRLYALDVEHIGLGTGATRAEVERALQGHVLDEAVLTGRYRR